MREERKRTMASSDRIASALERIADSLEKAVAPREFTLTLEPGDFAVHSPDERAEDATFEGFAEFIGGPNVPLADDEFELPDLRTFNLGDVIPDDVARVENPQGDVFAWRGDGLLTGFDFEEDPIGVLMPRDTTRGGWVTSDFPLAEVQYEDANDQPAFSLSEAAEILAQRGIDTGQRRLKDFLNTGIAWTDHFNLPRECASEYLRVVKAPSPNRDAVVRITAEGVDELARVMRVAV
jgi:hypothetical protein